jgi:hypothetical protein
VPAEGFDALTARLDEEWGELSGEIPRRPRADFGSTSTAVPIQPHHRCPNCGRGNIWRGYRYSVDDSQIQPEYMQCGDCDHEGEPDTFLGFPGPLNRQGRQRQVALEDRMIALGDWMLDTFPFLRPPAEWAVRQLDRVARRGRG